MSFLSILVLVLIAAIILAVLFTFFHILLALIPVIIIIALIFWLIGRFSSKESANTLSQEQSFWSYNKRYSQNGRKRARNVKTKDVDR